MLINSDQTFTDKAHSPNPFS